METLKNDATEIKEGSDVFEKPEAKKAKTGIDKKGKTPTTVKKQGAIKAVDKKEGTSVMAIGQLSEELGLKFNYALSSFPSKVAAPAKKARLPSSNPDQKHTSKKTKAADGKAAKTKKADSDKPISSRTHHFGKRRKDIWRWLASAGVRAGVSVAGVYGRRVPRRV